MPDDLDKSLVDGFQATAVILAFAAVLFAVRYPEIIADLSLGTPNANQQAEVVQYKNKLKKTKQHRILPMLVFLWVFTILMSPGSFQVAASVDLVPSHFDYIRSAWVFTNGTLLGFAVWTLVFWVRVGRKLKSV